MKFELQEISLLDYPGEVACILYVHGCNLSCPYCYNVSLWKKDYTNSVDEEYVLDFLKNRVGKLTAVVISGGEPFLNLGLFYVIKRIKKLGFKIKVFTNGTRFLPLMDCLPYIDKVNVSIKLMLGDYKKIGASRFDIRDLKNTINWLYPQYRSKFEFCTVDYNDLGVSCDYLGLDIKMVPAKLDCLILNNYLKSQPLTI